MNIVYKKVGQVILLTSTMVCTSIVEANNSTCATVSFIPTEINNDSYIATIIGNNGVSVRDYKHSRAIAKGEYEYSLAEGSHTLLVEQWRSGHYRRAFRKTGRQMKSSEKLAAIQTKTIQIDVEAGHHYDLEFSTNDQTAKVIVKSDILSKCTTTGKKLFAAKANANNNVSLPESLEYRLRRLMFKLNQHHKSIAKNSQFGNLVPVKLNNYFGLVFDKNHSTQNQSLRVLTVLPNSFAHKLGFISGDVITEFGQSPIKASVNAPSTILNNYLNELYFQGDISMKISRDGQAMLLKNKYIPVVIPEVSYNIDNTLSIASNQKASTKLKAYNPVINSTSIPSSLGFEFDQLILEIDDYYRQNNVNNSVTITRKTIWDGRYGIQGDMIESTQGVGFKILNVNNSSPASLIGLAKGDIVLAVNHQKLTELKINNITSKLEQLQPQDNYTLTILRDNKVVEVADVFQRTLLPGFNLNLDFESVSIVQSALGDRRLVDINKTTGEIERWIKNDIRRAIGHDPLGT
ncbi:MAG: PDZ domain-containing protein [Colwellia sp.]|nr:PDZ domain-containing protein [Colwellia sp.]